jgi:integrase
MAVRTLHRISAVKVRAAKTPGTHEDGGGLRLVVTNAGAKRWVMRITINGKRRELGLGGWPLVSLATAREKAGQIRSAAKEGHDIVAERRAKGRGIVTVAQAFDAFFSTKRLTLSNAKHIAQWPRAMQKYVFPFIGNRPVADVEAHEIIDMIAPIWRERPETARRILQRVEAVFKSAIVRGNRERASPCLGVAQEFGARRRAVKNYRFLPYLEIPDFVARLRSYPPSSARLALEWLVLTGARSGEVRFARWDEIDEAATLWTVPATRMKARKEHHVPLAPRCLGVLQQARSYYGAGEIVFPGSHPGNPLSDMTMTKVLRDMGLADRATVHGFRSSFKVWCAEAAKVRDEVSEAALAHSIPQKVRAAYLRTDFLEERRDLMQAWARFVDGD